MVNYDQLNHREYNLHSLYASARNLVPYVCIYAYYEFETDYIYTSVSYAGSLRIKYTSK